MPTMNDLYSDGSDHGACPICGWCLVCDGCVCNLPYEDVKGLYFPFERNTPQDFYRRGISNLLEEKL